MRALEDLNPDDFENEDGMPVDVIAPQDDDVDAIRVFVSGGGCSGMTYGMTFTGDKFDNDKTFEADGFKEPSQEL